MYDARYLCYQDKLCAVQLASLVLQPVFFFVFRDLALEQSGSSSSRIQHNLTSKFDKIFLLWCINFFIPPLNAHVAQLLH